MKGKICFTASSGGHLEEIARLVEVADTGDAFLVTEKGGFQEINFCKNVHYVNQINRKEKLFLFKLIQVFWQSFRILIKEKPVNIISTGALATIPICILGKIMRKRIIYIESFARIDSPSLTGKVMYHVADLFIVQWEEMLKIFPKAKYGGGIF